MSGKMNRWEAGTVREENKPRSVMSGEDFYRSDHEEPCEGGNEAEDRAEKPKPGLCSRFALPDAFWSEEMIVWRNGYFSLRGCRRILSFSGECVKFRLSDLNLTVTGRNLICLSFEGGEVTLGGTVRDISFSSTEVRG